jgi:dolichyl-phosphate beta-glucosyltransferase
LIFPAYNESARIRKTVEEAVTILTAVDWPMKLSCRPMAQMARARSLLRWPRQPGAKGYRSVERLGKGHGLREGIRLASGNWIGFSDADNKTPVEELDKILPWLRQGWDMVIGSRAMPASQIEHRQPLYRQLVPKDLPGHACFPRLE